MADKLATYRGKRDRDRTPEPVPVPTGPLPAGDDDTFVIQEHHARRLHWDVRLERDGVLVSWAVPKGLPLDPATNHLAVHTEDHPIEYAAFEGDIPHGEYGGGSVTIWDRGRYDTEKWTDREVKVVLHGTRVQGRYVFFRTRGTDWMVHRMDPPPAGWHPPPDRLVPMRPIRGRLPALDEDDGWAYEMAWGGLRAIVLVAGGRVIVHVPDQSPEDTPVSAATLPAPNTPTGRRGEPGSGGRSRGATQAAVQAGREAGREAEPAEEARPPARSRRGRPSTIADSSADYPELRGLGVALGSRSSVLDGEIVVLDGDGRPDPALLRRRTEPAPTPTGRRSAGKRPAVTFLAGDLLYLAGRDLTDVPYTQRRELLDSLSLNGPNWAVAPSLRGGDIALAAARDLGLADVVAKPLDSGYRPGNRADAWRVINTCEQRWARWGRPDPIDQEAAGPAAPAT